MLGWPTTATLRLLGALCLVQFFQSGQCFIAPTRLLQLQQQHQQQQQQLGAARQLATAATSGSHGQGFHFMPMIRTGSKEHFPRILPIAGVFPGITTQELLAPRPNPSAPQGSWSYDFSDIGGVQLGKVAIPGADIITDAVDPVVIITSNTALKIQAVTEIEMLLVIDRKDPEPFDADNFYLFRRLDTDELEVLWCERPPADKEILGKVVTAVLPWVPGMKKAASGFAEEDEEED